jgi:hypothetical protein
MPKVNPKYDVIVESCILIDNKYTFASLVNYKTRNLLGLIEGEFLNEEIV